MIKSKARIYDELSPIFDGIEKERLQYAASTKQWIRILLFSMIGLILLGIFLFYNNYLSLQANRFMPFLYFLITVASIMLGMRLVLLKKYQAHVKTLLVNPIMNAMYPGLTFDHDKHIEKQQFLDCGLFTKRITSFSGEDLIYGDLKNTTFSFSEILARRKQGKRLTTIFKGLFVIADFHKHFKGETIIYPENSPFGMKINANSKLKITEFENVDFEKAYKVRTSDIVEARYILSLKMMENILELERKFGCKLALSFKGANVYIAIPWKNDLLGAPLDVPAKETFFEFYEELRLCFSIIEELDLNTRIWTKV